MDSTNEVAQTALNALTGAAFGNMVNTPYSQVIGSRCPNCGYCPHCGRSSTPFPSYPYYPYWPNYPLQPYTVTWASGNSLTNVAYNAI